jgi:hypothetical protein
LMRHRRYLALNMAINVVSRKTFVSYAKRLLQRLPCVASKIAVCNLAEAYSSVKSGHEERLPNEKFRPSPAILLVNYFTDTKHNPTSWLQCWLYCWFQVGCSVGFNVNSMLVVVFQCWLQCLFQRWSQWFQRWLCCFQCWL